VRVFVCSTCRYWSKRGYGGGLVTSLSYTGGAFSFFFSVWCGKTGRKIDTDHLHLSSDSSHELQMQRLIMRDNLTQTDAQDRVAAQLPLIDKVQYADRVIDNSGGLQELARQVDAVVAALRRKAGWSWRLAWWFPPLAVVMGLWRISERIVRFALFRRGIGVSRTQS
jgi:hypothetical protein